MKHIGLRIAAAIVFLFCNNRISAQTDGYLSARAASQGETLRFYISTPLPQFDLKIYKLGLFKKEVLTLTNLPGGIQSTDDSAFINGCNWRVTKEFTIPLTWSSGIYEADIPSADTIKKLIFIVREKYLGKHSKTLVCLTENTWQAYNNWADGVCMILIPIHKPDRLRSALTVRYRIRRQIIISGGRIFLLSGSKRIISMLSSVSIPTWTVTRIFFRIIKLM